MGDLQNTRKSNGEEVPRAGVGGGGPAIFLTAGIQTLGSTCPRSVLMEGRGSGALLVPMAVGGAGQNLAASLGHPHLALPPLSVPGGQWPPTPSIQAFPAVQGPLSVSSYPPPSPLEHSALICKPLGQFKELLFKEGAILTFLKL